MVDKLDIAAFIIERQKTSWSELEEKFVNLSSDKTICPKCKSSDITILEGAQTSIIPGVKPAKTRELYCENCRAMIWNAGRIARQTLLNQLKTLIREGLIEKVIDGKTLRPVYQVTPGGRAKLEEMAVKKKIHLLIDRGNFQEALHEIEELENKLKKN